MVGTTTEERPNFLEFRSKSFRDEITQASLIYEIKRVSAVWDPDMHAGDGGWRCPPGTVNAGQWSDQLGRNCGGASRRLGNAIGNIGRDVAHVARESNNEKKPAGRASRLEARARDLEERVADPNARRKQRARKLEERAAAMERAAGIERDPETHKPKLIRPQRAEPAPRSAFIRPPGDEARKRRNARKRRIGDRPEALRAREGAPKREPVGVRKARREEAARQREANQVARNFVAEIVGNPNLEADLDIRDRPDKIKKRKAIRATDGQIHLNMQQYQFDSAGVEEIESYLDGIDKRLFKSGAMMDDLPGIQKEIEDYEQLQTNIHVLLVQSTEALLQARRDERNGKQINDVAIGEHQVNLHKYKAAHELVGARMQELQEREVFLRDRDAAKENLDFALNKDNDPADRADALKNLQWYLDHGVTPKTEAAAVGVHDFWQAMAAQHAAAVPSVQAALEDQYGVYNDFNQVLNLGGTLLKKRQEKVEKALKLFGDDTEKDTTLLNVMLEDMNDELAQLGPVVRALTPEDRYENNTRQWLTVSINRLNEAKINNRKPVEGRLNIYNFEPKKLNPSLGEPFAEGHTVAIQNPTIKSSAAAVQHVADGGSMNDVPNKYWAAALSYNSSYDDHDTTKRFRRKSPNGGAIGETMIFLDRDENGDAVQSGWVLKAARDRDNVGEVMSQILMTEHGFPVNGPGWDGDTRSVGIGGETKQFVILPYAANALPEGDVEFARRGGLNYDPSLLEGSPDDGLPQRLHGLLHNYVMGVTDRHGGNGFTVYANGEAFVIPIDQGWAGQNMSSNLNDYARSEFGAGWGMDPKLLFKMEERSQYLPPEDLARYQEKITEVYDSMIEAGDRVVEQGIDNLMNRIFAAKDAPSAEETDRVTHIWNMYQDRIASLKANRKAFLKRVKVL
jgi:hypothetical protein